MNSEVQGVEEIPTAYPYYESIISLIKEIDRIHNEFSHQCMERYGLALINLKKKQIRHIFNDELQVISEAFFSLIQEYTELLVELVARMTLEYQYVDLDFRLRIKQKESIVNKLRYYRLLKKEEGKVAINKCINDLLGFRITLKDFDHNCKEFDQMCQSIQEEHKIKKENSSKGDYKATHIYFRGESNSYFPWELQIWNEVDASQNEQSHKEHKNKREYINWPNTYKESKEEFEGGVS